MTSSSDEKLARVEADVKVDHGSEDVVEAVKAATEGRGADVVVEHVGEATWQRTLQAARTGGRIAVCGATSGPNPPAALHRIWWKQLTIYGSTMGTKEDFEGAYELVASGKARPVIDEVFPLEEARAAHERMEAGEQLGKIVLTIGDYRIRSRRARDGRERTATAKGTRGRIQGLFQQSGFRRWETDLKSSRRSVMRRSRRLLGRDVRGGQAAVDEERRAVHVRRLVAGRKSAAFTISRGFASRPIGR